MKELAGRDSFGRYRARMDAIGFRPSRRLGQNFLLDPSLHRALVELAGVEADDLVLEVGAGLGFLTRELAARRARVLAVEVDRRLEGLLAEDLPTFPDSGCRVRLCRGDVLSGSTISPWLCEVLAEEIKAHPRFLVVANLPYAVAGPVLAELGSLERPPDGIAVLVQAELAERIAAGPGERAYGGLTAVLQASYSAEIGRRVGREVFRPRPRVDSAFLALVRRRDGGLLELPVSSRRHFAAFVRTLFQGRRKTLRNVLPGACPGIEAARLAAVPADTQALRPGALSVDELVRIWRTVSGLP